MKFLACLAAALMAAISLAQKPLIAQIPTPHGSKLPMAIEAARLAAWLRYDGVAFTPTSITGPNTISLDGLRQVIRQGAAGGMRRFWVRLDLGVPMTPAWIEANGGQTWPVRTRPPYKIRPLIAAQVQKIVNAAAEECRAVGLDPNTALLFALMNEPGIGGVGGPYLKPYGVCRGDVERYIKSGYTDRASFDRCMPAEFWGRQEGYVEPGYWTILRQIRGRVTFGTLRVGLGSFEGYVPLEFRSFQGVDAAWLSSATSGWMLNCYADAGALLYGTGGTAEKYSSKIASRVALARSSTPLLAKRVWLMEGNAFRNRIPSTADPSVYRAEILRGMRDCSAIEGGSVFTILETDSASSSTGLYTRDATTGVWTPVGAQGVGPWMILGKNPPVEGLP